MKVCVLGSTFAPKVFREIWANHFAIVRKPEDADLVFYSTDTPIGIDGKRDTSRIGPAVQDVYARINVPLILTSQVEPGFTRALGIPIYHMAETLRIKDAKQRAAKPEYIALGCPDPATSLPVPIMRFAIAFDCPVIRCSWESAEFSKIAVNMMLAAQVDRTNMLAKAADRCGADWEGVRRVLMHDRRIGAHAYLTPGRWEDSQHLMRDYVTLQELLK